MKTLTTQHQTIAIPASADPSSLAWRVYQIALAALSASTIGGLSPAEIEIRIEVRGSDALAEIVEAAACNAVRGCGIDAQRWERYAMRHCYGSGGNEGNESEE